LKHCDSALERVIATLKNLLRGRSLLYADVATKLAVSERSVQRWLNGEALTLEVLTKLCETVDVTLAELLTLAENTVDQRPRSLTEEQEEGLAAVPLRAFIFTRLLQNWTTEELQSACALDKPSLLRHLLALERLGLIEVHPGNRVRLLTRRNIEWRRGGAMSRRFTKFARKLVNAMDFGDADSIWTSEVVNLTPQSALLMDMKLQALRHEMRELAQSNRDAPAEEKQWYSFVSLAYCHDQGAPDDPLSWAFSNDARGG
jgi:transcriptional regulator with XRE-family HTH domain